jgi:hypothetical protein
MSSSQYKFHLTAVTVLMKLNGSFNPLAYHLSFHTSALECLFSETLKTISVFFPQA